MRIRIIAILIGIILIIGLSAIYSVLFQQERKETSKVSERESVECLDENKEALYKSEDRESALADLTIFVNDKSTGRELFSFKIDNVYRTVPRAELHKCGIYAIRFFNYDSKKSKQDPGFKVEIWKYQYDGEGTPFFLLSEKEESGLTKGNYSYAFRIDPNEKHLVLENSYLGKDDYALVIKDLNTKEDIFALPIQSIAKQCHDCVGSFGMLEWTNDSRYFWGDIFDGAYVNGYFRIDASKWKADIFKAPDGAMGGMPLNVNTGYMPIQPGLVWTGDAELTQELKEKERREGKKSSLHLYSLFTKEEILIETTDEPQFFFKPKWISDTELEYALPTGEKKIHTINPH